MTIGSKRYQFFVLINVRVNGNILRVKNSHILLTHPVFLNKNEYFLYLELLCLCYLFYPKKYPMILWCLLRVEFQRSLTKHWTLTSETMSELRWSVIIWAERVGSDSGTPSTISDEFSHRLRDTQTISETFGRSRL